ncbi:MAG: FAD binding domain-containing protein [Desulfobacterales bacterium]|nr:FAD binding domain-containing protein [Desulfobacterales bacterium]
MKLPNFEYFEPNDIQEAVAILQKQPSARILAGGTDLLVNMKHRVELPEVLVNIKRIAGLDGIESDDHGIRIGALTPLKRIYSTPWIGERLPALAQAASSVGAYHHQSMGSLGGNLCQQNRCKFFNQSRWWRSSRPTCYKAGGDICHVVNQKEICYSGYCGDVAPALLVLNATVTLAGAGGTRQIPLEDLFTGDGKAPLQLDRTEVLTEVAIPRESLDVPSSYIKFANRESIDFPIVGCAFLAAGTGKEYRIAFTAVDRKPVRGKKVEAFLKGKDLTEDHLKESSGLAAKAASPARTTVYAPSYKRKLMGALVHKAANKAMRRPD